jgi:GNAT superfamily N-acetyltransferase
MPHDAERIVREIFPLIGEQEANDKRYVALLGNPGIQCFLGEDGGMLAHYCWVFERALASPLVRTPFNREILTEHDAYIGPAFTTPSARGKWLFPCAIAAALTYLRLETEATRAILCVHRDNPGGVAFFRRLGFQIIERPTRSVFFARLWNAHPKRHE